MLKRPGRRTRSGWCCGARIRISTRHLSVSRGPGVAHPAGSSPLTSGPSGSLTTATDIFWAPLCSVRRRRRARRGGHVAAAHTGVFTGRDPRVALEQSAVAAAAHTYRPLVRRGGHEGDPLAGVGSLGVGHPREGQGVATRCAPRRSARRRRTGSTCRRSPPRCPSRPHRSRPAAVSQGAGRRW